MKWMHVWNQVICIHVYRWQSVELITATVPSGPKIPSCFPSKHVLDLREGGGDNHGREGYEEKPPDTSVSSRKLTESWNQRSWRNLEFEEKRQPEKLKYRGTERGTQAKPG